MAKIKIVIQKLIDMNKFKIIRSLFYKIQKETFPKDMENEFGEIYEKCKFYTMTSRARMYALYQAVKYIVKSKVQGDFVECGVWKGGSTMLIALTLLKCEEANRKIYLYDTFEGMPKPTSKDQRITDGKQSYNIWKQGPWCNASLDEVKKNMLSLGYPETNVIFIKGKVEDTIPENIPPQISLLRLDTDFYESIYHELKHLFPLILNKGVIIIDDYGYWAGVKEATDKYFSENAITMLLNRIDQAGRLGIKIR
ncbi:TylF/MycF/NovP-related O-methyltransferase [Chlamydiota bacterium]